jgi:hypothetical protein
MSLPVELCEHLAQDCLQAAKRSKDPPDSRVTSHTRGSVDRGCARSIEAIESGLLEEQTIVKHDDNLTRRARIVDSAKVNSQTNFVVVRLILMVVQFTLRIINPIDIASFQILMVRS